MNTTTNYQLSQWETSDRVLRTDFNSDNSKLDAALKANADAVAAAQSAAAGANPYTKLLEETVTADSSSYTVSVSDIHFAAYRRIEFEVIFPSSYTGSKNVWVQANGFTSYSCYRIGPGSASSSESISGFAQVGMESTCLLTPSNGGKVGGWSFDFAYLYCCITSTPWNLLSTLALVPLPGNTLPAGTVFRIYGVRG